MDTDLDLRTLVSYLSPLARKTLESAAGRAVQYTHYSVCREHWLLTMLEDDGTDAVAILTHYDVDLSTLRGALDQRLKSFVAGNSRTPAMEKELWDLIRRAYYVATSDNYPIVRTGHILFALSNEARPSAWASYLSDLIPHARLTEELTFTLHGLTEHTKESAGCKPVVARRRCHVFISYCHSDFSFAATIASALEANDIKIWMDRRSVGIGQDWDEMIDNAIEQCHIMIIVMSPESVESLEVRSELKAARDQRKAIIPVLKAPCRIPRYLSLLQYVNVTDCEATDHRVIEQILGRIRSIKQEFNPAPETKRAIPTAPPQVSEDDNL